jgi:hypothetical protein
MGDGSASPFDSSLVAIHDRQFVIKFQPGLLVQTKNLYRITDGQIRIWEFYRRFGLIQKDEGSKDTFIRKSDDLITNT